MRTKAFSIFFLALFAFVGGWTQSGNLPESHIRWRQERGGDKGPERSSLDIFYYSYSTPTLDLRNFKTQVPERAEYIPDFVEIAPPDLHGFSDTAYAVGWLHGDLPQSGHLLVMIVGNLKTPDPTFFVDWNLNGDFRGDGKPLKFVYKNAKGKLKYRERLRVRVTSPEPDVQTYHFWLMNPVPDASDTIRKPMKLRDRLTFRGYFDLGLGKLRYDYVNPHSGYPTNYSVRTTNKGISLQLGIRLGKFQIVPRFDYENVFYWSSKRITRLGEPYVVCGVPGQGCVTFENIQVVRDREVIPTARLTYGAAVEYDLQMGKRFRLSPFAGMGIQQYAGDFREDKVDEASYKLSPSVYFEYGSSFKAYFDQNHAILFNISQRHSTFAPDGYFESLSAQDVKTINRTLILGIGVQIGIL